MHVEVTIEEEAWPDLGGAERLAQEAVAAVFATLARRGDDISLAVAFTSDAEVEALNRRWRGKAKPTNVLSFPAPAAELVGKSAVPRRHSGESRNPAGHRRIVQSGTPAFAGVTAEGVPLTAEAQQFLGDVILAGGVVAEEARAQSKPLASHAAHLIVHGTLHLLGFDHEDDAGAEAMEAVEVRALKRLGIADPYEAQSD